MAIWKPVVGYEGYYEVSNDGRVRSLDRIIRCVDVNGAERTRIFPGRVLRATIDGMGYPSFKLSMEGKTKTHHLHALMLTAFKGEAPEGYIGRHRDGDSLNNTLRNLVWSTRTDNQLDIAFHRNNPRQVRK
jgi:hypothetical protein